MVKQEFINFLGKYTLSLPVLKCMALHVNSANNFRVGNRGWVIKKTQHQSIFLSGEFCDHLLESTFHCLEKYRWRKTRESCFGILNSPGKIAGRGEGA